MQRVEPKDTNGKVIEHLGLCGGPGWYMSNALNQPSCKCGARFGTSTINSGALPGKPQGINFTLCTPKIYPDKCQNNEKISDNDCSCENSSDNSMLARNYNGVCMLSTNWSKVGR